MLTRLTLIVGFGLGAGCIEAPPLSLPDSEDITTVDMGADAGSDVGEDSSVLPEPTEPTCDDGVKNQDETDIDCGGSCRVCAIGKTCSNGDDCQSGLCKDRHCEVPDNCTVSESISPEQAYNADCTSIKFPEGYHELDFEIGRSIELSGSGPATELGQVVLKDLEAEDQVIINRLSFFEIQGSAIKHLDGKLKVQDVRFVNNSTTGQGGAIYSEGTSGGRLDIVNCEFSGNTARQGGSIYASYPPESESVSVVNSNFTGSVATGENAAGGAMYVDGASVSITDSTFIGNRVVQGGMSPLSGGAIHVAGQGVGALRIRRVSFIVNDVESNSLAEGGAISTRDQNLEIAESYFMENQVIGDLGLGGAIMAVGSSISVVQTTFRSNKSVGVMEISRGGAIYAQGESEGLILVNSTLSGQQLDAFDRSGSALFLTGMSFESYSNTFSNNTEDSVVVELEGQTADVMVKTDNTIYGDAAGPNFPEAMGWSGINIIAEQLEPDGKFFVADPELEEIADTDGTWVHVPKVGSPALGFAGPCAGPRGAMHLQQDQLKQARPVGECTIGAVQSLEVP